MDYKGVEWRINDEDNYFTRKVIEEFAVDGAEKLRYLANKLERAAKAEYIRLSYLDEISTAVIIAGEEFMNNIDDKLEAVFSPIKANNA